MRFWAAVILYGVLFGAPLYFLTSFVPIINQARRLGVTIQDVTLYQLRDESRARFAGYDPLVPAEHQRAALLARLGGDRKFGRDVWAALCEWGRQVAREESGREDCSDGEAVAAAVDRLTARDRKAANVEELIRHFQPARPGDRPTFQTEALDRWSYPRSAMWFLHVFYPNDDVGYLAFGWQDMWDPARSGEAKAADGSFGPDLIFLVGASLAFSLLIQRGARVLTIRGLGRVLGLRPDPAYRAYECDMFSPGRQMMGLALLLPAGCLLGTYALDPFYVVYFRSSALLYAAVFWNALVGGVLVEGIENVIAIGVIKAGYDPRRIVWDNALAAAISAGVLLYFQNSWLTIALALGVGLFLNVLHKLHAGRAAVRAAELRGTGLAERTGEHGGVG